MMAWRTIPVALLALSLAGCFGSTPSLPDGVEVGGKVLLPGGAPLTGGTLVLRPVAGIHGASGLIAGDGTFKLTGPGGKPAVVPGKYLVYVRLMDASQKALAARVPARYQNTEDSDSDVTVEITTAKSDLVIQLKK